MQLLARQIKKASVHSRACKSQEMSPRRSHPTSSGGSCSRLAELFVSIWTHSCCVKKLLLIALITPSEWQAAGMDPFIPRPGNQSSPASVLQPVSQDALWSLHRRSQIFHTSIRKLHKCNLTTFIENKHALRGGVNVNQHQLVVLNDAMTGPKQLKTYCDCGDALKML